MFKTRIAASLAIAALVLGGCSNDNSTGGTGTPKLASLAVVNGTRSSKGATLTLDAAQATLPPFGQTAIMQASVGHHVLTLTAQNGHTLATANISLDSVSVGTAVFTGADTVVVTVGADTTSTPPTNPGSSLPGLDTVGTFPPATGVSPLGFVLMVNGTGGDAEGLSIQLVGTDSIEHFNFLAAPATSAYSFAYVPGTYTITVNAPNNNTVLATATITIAANDQWVAHILKAADGTISLTTGKL